MGFRRTGFKIALCFCLLLLICAVCLWNVKWFLVARGGLRSRGHGFGAMAVGLLHKAVGMRRSQGPELTFCSNMTSSALRVAASKELQTLHFTADVHHSLYLYAAYWDRRPTLNTSAVVRVFGMMHRDQLGRLNVTSCLLWGGADPRPLHTPASWNVMWGYICPYHSVMLTCQLPAGSDVMPLTHVTVTEAGCTSAPTNVLQITPSPDAGEDTGKTRVAVCAKVLYNSPDPTRLVEWVELQHLLGAERVYLYNTSVSGAVNDVLRYYTQQDMVTLVKHDFPRLFAQALFNQSFPTRNYNENWELEILSMNDCLYRASEPYLVNVDIDEVLYLPDFDGYADYLDRIANVKRPLAASLVFKTGVYSDELAKDSDPALPLYLHTLTHNRRTIIDYESPKSILRRLHCRTAGHHVCLRALPGYPPRTDIAPSFGHLRHYRRRCRLTGEPHKCEKLLKKPVIDRTLEKHRQALDARVKPVLQMFDLVKS